MTGERVSGDVEVLQIGEVEIGDGAGEAVRLEAESEEVSEAVEFDGEVAGEVVVGQIEAVEAGERGEGGWEVAGEGVEGEEEELERGEVGEIGNVAGEAVALEAENSELSEGC